MVSFVGNIKVWLKLFEKSSFMWYHYFQFLSEVQVFIKIVEIIQPFMLIKLKNTRFQLKLMMLFWFIVISFNVREKFTLKGNILNFIKISFFAFRWLFKISDTIESFWMEDHMGERVITPLTSSKIVLSRKVLNSFQNHIKELFMK